MNAVFQLELQITISIGQPFFHRTCAVCGKRPEKYCEPRPSFPICEICETIRQPYIPQEHVPPPEPLPPPEPELSGEYEEYQEITSLRTVQQRPWTVGKVPWKEEGF